MQNRVAGHNCNFLPGRHNVCRTTHKGLKEPIRAVPGKQLKMTEKKEETKEDRLKAITAKLFAEFFQALSREDEEEGGAVAGCVTIVVTTGDKVQSLCAPYCDSLTEFAALAKLSEEAVRKEWDSVCNPKADANAGV